MRSIGKGLPPPIPVVADGGYHITKARQQRHYGKHTNATKMVHFLLKTVGRKPLQQTKTNRLHSGEQSVQWIKYSYPHNGSNKRGLATAATSAGGGHGQRVSQYFFLHLASLLLASAGPKTPTAEEARGVVEECLRYRRRLEIPANIASCCPPQGVEDSLGPLARAVHPLAATRKTGRRRLEVRRPVLDARPLCQSQNKELLPVLHGSEA